MGIHVLGNMRNNTEILSGIRAGIRTRNTLKTKYKFGYNVRREAEWNMRVTMLGKKVRIKKEVVEGC